MVPTPSSRYIAIANEIEHFINSKKEKTGRVRGKVTEIDGNLLTVKADSIHEIYLSKGSLVLIDAGISDMFSKTLRASVVDKYGAILKLEVKDSVNKLLDKEVYIDCSRTNVILERLGEVVEKIKENNLDEDNIRILNFILGAVKPSYSRKKIKLIAKKLNSGQQKAITNSLQANDFHLITGPPGTGKTHTIVELINQLTKEKQKILVTAWTNLAVDNIVERLPKGTNVVRIGPLNKIKPKLRKYSIVERIKEHKNWKEIEAGEKLIQDLWASFNNTEQDIRDAQIRVEELLAKRNVFNKERNKLASERKDAEGILNLLVYNQKLPNLSAIKQDMNRLENHANSYLNLAIKLLELERLKKRLPSRDSYQTLKAQVKKLRLQLISKKALFFVSTAAELKNLRGIYHKKRTKLVAIDTLLCQYHTLKKEVDADFGELYSEDGQPDKDALDLYTALLNLLLERYLPMKKEEIQTRINKETMALEKESYSLYKESLMEKMDLLDTNITTINTDLYVQINKRKNLNINKENILETIKQYKKNVSALRKEAMSDMIYDADIVTSTALSSCSYYLDDSVFEVMIMDEASQVASFHSLLPLLKCKKFVLVGDRKQLQPIVEEKMGEKLNMSIFNRLFDIYPNASTLLTTQYRMHKKIAEIASEVFYEGRLKTSKEAAERIVSIRGKKKHFFLNANVPTAFIDTCDAGYYEDEVGGSCANSKEAGYVAYVVSLFIKNNIKPQSIGVVTPYIKQKLLIKSLLDEMNIKNVEVDTVHKYQGREKDIIIVSFGRSKKFVFPSYKLKFVENKTLVNVAITRAKKKLILVGDSKTLKRSSLLKNVLEKVGKENTTTLS